jgi:hypothetical protein
VPVGRIEDVFRFAAARRLTVYACALKRLSLEDVFISVLGRSNP